MPTYDLKCNRCNFTFQVTATVDEREKNRIPCPGCGGRELTRVYDGANIAMMSRGAVAEAQKANCKCCAKASECENSSLCK